MKFKNVSLSDETILNISVSTLQNSPNVYSNHRQVCFSNELYWQKCQNKCATKASPNFRNTSQ